MGGVYGGGVRDWDQGCFMMVGGLQGAEGLANGRYVDIS